MMVIAFALSGCTKQYYSDSFEKNVISQGKEILTKYLGDNYTDYKLVGNLVMVRGYGNTPEDRPGRSFGSTIAKAKVEIDGKEYNFYVDTDTNTIYSDYYMEYVEQYFFDIIKSNIAEMGIDFYYGYKLSTQLSLNSYSDNTESKKNQGIYDVKVSLGNVFDVEMTREDIINDILQDTERNGIVVNCYYSVEEEKTIDCKRIFDCMKTNGLLHKVNIYSVATPYFDIMQAEDVVPDSFMLGADEYYEFLSSNNDLSCRRSITSTTRKDNIVVRYVSNITVYNSELQEIESNDYESSAYFDDDELTIKRSKSKTYLYFEGKPEYSRVKVERYRADGSKNKPDDLIIVKLADGFYSFSAHGDRGYRNEGYSIYQDTLVTFSK